MLDTLYLWEQYRQSDRFWVEAITLREKGRLGEAAEAAAASLAAAPWLHDYSRPAFLPLTEAEFFDRARSIQKARGGVTPSDRFDAAVLALHARITSYNVCYTKLLRGQGSRADAGRLSL